MVAKLKNKLCRRFFLASILLPLLSGCSYMPDMSQMHWPDWSRKETTAPAYPPLNNEPVAIRAAPESPPEPPSSGKKVFCRVGKGSARFSSGWLDFLETEFTLVDNVTGHIPVTGEKKESGTSFQGLFDWKGQKITFCPETKGLAAGEKISCTSIYALDEDLSAGIKRTLDVPAVIRGGGVSCASSPDKIQKL